MRGSEEGAMRNEMICLAVIMAAYSTVAAGQDAPKETPTTVTFYSGGSLLKTALPQTNSATFEGCIFDGEQSLGCISYRGFMTVTVTAGKHLFSASLSSHHPAKNSQLEMTLEPGKNYYVRAVAEISAFKYVIGAMQGRLDTVSCQVAHDETKNSGEVKESKMTPWHKKPAPAEVPPCSPTS